MVPAQKLVDGRIALVGDAGYCPTFMSGMGAAAALQGAYCLAAQVDRHADPMDALRQYEQKILPIDLRTLFMQAARVILLRPASWPKHSFGDWLTRAAQRLHPNVLAAALANKLARIAWTVLAQERSYEARITKAAA